jgi:hypothetical protein
MSNFIFNNYKSFNILISFNEFKDTDCSNISKVMKSKKEATNFLEDEYELYTHPSHLSNKKYFRAMFTEEIKVGFICKYH